MDTLQEELDRSFGDGPSLPSVDTHVAAGRRALRRRRVASGVAGLAAAGVLATGWYAVAPSTETGSAQVAGGTSPATPSASASASEAADPTTGPTAAPWPRGELVRYVDGELEVRPGVTVHERIRNPYGFEPPQRSDALDLTWKGHRQWVMIEKRAGRGGDSWSASTPSAGWASFADYVADQVGVNGGSGWPETFELDGQGRVVATAGTRVFNRTDDPQLGPAFASPGAKTGAAVVSVAGDEASYFVVWRVVDGTLDVITTNPDDVVGATFEELLSGARAKYASGEGLR
ncbi:hypothetical protein [Nocardioides mesophilus]|uniref:Uncharacterized protein n=1 Tax=Nocardioides mesophilus TaxID=433659 RepID=A0A7G9REJ5_9ACTN|nr:hypothetical protein [Nocardioides mesophilus]QNN54020.1 hypothetical protein H9L09_06475 [Nocardioides mesophilus]